MRFVRTTQAFECAWERYVAPAGCSRGWPEHSAPAADSGALPPLIHNLRPTMATIGPVATLDSLGRSGGDGRSAVPTRLDRSSDISTDLQRDGAARLEAALDRALGTDRAPDPIAGAESG